MVFNKGFNVEIDILQNKIDMIMEYFHSLSRKLSNCIDVDQDNLVKLKITEKDGHFFTLTKAKGKILKHKLSTQTDITWSYTHTIIDQEQVGQVEQGEEKKKEKNGKWEMGNGNLEIGKWEMGNGKLEFGNGK